MKLSDCCLKIGSGATPRGGKESYLEEGPFSLIRSQNIHNNLFVRAGLAFISDVQAKQLQNVDLQPDDVLLNITGDSVARVCQVPKDVLPARVNQHVAIIRPDPTKLFHKYLHYFLVNPKMQTHMLTLSSAGATRNALTKGMIEFFEVPSTSITNQKAIASVLGALDDKIENNRWMNETLEEMAQAIFKSWFVDFDPVHANAANNSPAHMDADTAALFPSSFGDDGVPVGWGGKYLPDLIDFKEGPGLRNWQYTNSDEGVRFINIRCIKNKDLELSTANRVTELEAYGKYAHFLLEADDIIISTSGSLGRFSFVRQEHLPLMLNTSVIRMRPISKKSTREFLYGYLGSKEFQNELEIRATGSVQKNFGPVHLKQMYLIAPGFEVMEAYSKQTKVLINKFLFNLKENQTLSDLRDTLLPKLMSGEIRMKDAERAVESAV
jgi:type I restriction enzyme S subunit